MKTGPDRCELLWLLRGELGHAVIEEMAGYDDGFDKANHLEVLTDIYRTGEVPCPLRWCPAEVCNQLSGGSCDRGKPLSPKDRRDATIRLFALWILLNAYANPEERNNGLLDREVESHLFTLVETSLALGAAYVHASARFVAWAQARGAAAGEPEGILYYLLSQLILWCSLPDGAAIAAALAVYDTLIFEEQKFRRPHWLFDLERRWKDMATWVLDRMPALFSGEFDPKLVEFRRRLLNPPE